MSPRNSAPAIADMMKKTNCRRIMTLDHAHHAIVEGVRHELEYEVFVDELPTLRQLFPKLGKETSADGFTPYPSPAVRPDINSPAIYAHSSGSTGFPKPIGHTHKTQIHWLTQPPIYAYAGMSPLPRLGGMGLPPFHSYGFAIQVYSPMACGISVSIFAPTSVDDPRITPTIPNSDNMLDCARKTGTTIITSVPSFLEQWAMDENAVNYLKTMEYVIYGGGPLPVKVGDALQAAGVIVGAEYGGTEFGCPVMLPRKEDIASGDWLWMRFSPDIKVRWAPQDDETYELQVLTTETNQMAVENLPDVKGYATSDVFVKHPTKENLWRIVGRTDDVLILASGEKTVPAPMESIIGSNPYIQGTVMFGRERNQVGILIEPRGDHVVDINDDKQVAEFRNKIWPSVEEANKTAPAFSRIFKEMILITDPDKPMFRAGKGTVQKKATIKDYETEIDALYELVEASTEIDESAIPQDWTEAGLKVWLNEQTKKINSDDEIDPDIDFFSQGFDSLSATYLRNRIIGGLRNSSDGGLKNLAPRVSQNIIFENPTVNLLAKKVASLVGYPEQHAEDPRQSAKRVMETMIEKYSNGLNASIANGVAHANGHSNGEVVVLLTGSTGGLGSFLLAQLLENPEVTRVYAYNRPSKQSTSDARQAAAFQDRDLSLQLLDSKKLVYLEGDAAQERCGLDANVYEQIRQSVTVVIHNAWRLDFNLSITSFEPNIRGTRNLIDLALSSAHKSSLRLVFTSSIGSAQSWDQSKGPFPEEVQDAGVAVGSGYGESKYVCERLIVKSGLHATSLRIGQIAGGPNGSWATTDWLPIIVKSSLALGILPEAQGLVSWMPADGVASAVSDIALAKEPAPPVLNIVHPRPVSWLDVMGPVRKAVIAEKGIKESALTFAPFATWFARLEELARSANQADLQDIPAIKLLEFFRASAHAEGNLAADKEAGGVSLFSTTKAQRVSKTLRELPQLGNSDAEAWVHYWIKHGM
ncbi:putative nonribosomal peptide synthetase [Hygrophoropsis aurantiaca]|uniref:Nonribosomal peptide synthetase n=1 Tax=Hygrophoropsis aurantiaca TaxID=72124 RepID=A0ACB8AIZ8_9AGAM|nr:putative nonribosomal peptide synthetase [Hygrophoropsis aurantiaca]